MSKRPRRPKWSTPKHPPQNRQERTATPAPASLRDQILSDFSDLRVPLSAEDFDAALRRAEQEGLSPLEFLRLVISQQAQGRRERAIERRIHQAYFAEAHTLEDFDWKCNAKTIDRVQIEALASGEFVRRHDNLIVVGQSGLGKSHILQGLGRRFCALGDHVRSTTSAELLVDLTAALADRTLPQPLRYWCRFDLLIVDEFGFDKLERSLSPQAANLLYKVIDARHGQNSTALATNIDLDYWGEYLGDPPLAMAFIDRIVDGALLMKLEGESYRANRAKRLDANHPKKAG